MHKRALVGIPDRALKMVVFSLLMTFVILFFIGIGLSYRTPYVPKMLDVTLTSERFVSTCFSYQDPDTLRTYPGMIDISKFTQEKMAKCYSPKKAQVRAYRLKLVYDSKEAIVQSSNWIGKKPDVLTKSVIVKTADDTYPGLLHIGYDGP